MNRGRRLKKGNRFYDLHEQRIAELRKRILNGEPLFLAGERYEVGGGSDESGPATIYRPGDLSKERI